MQKTPQTPANYHLSPLKAQLCQIKVTVLKRPENQPLQRLTVAEVTLEKGEQITAAFSLQEERRSVQAGRGQLRAWKTEAHSYRSHSTNYSK